MPGLDDYGALLRSGAASVPDYAADEVKKQLAAAQIGEVKAKLIEQQRAIAEAGLRLSGDERGVFSRVRWEE
jgi:hypothetical protein